MSIVTTIQSRYEAGGSGQVSVDQGFIGKRSEPWLATAGELALYRPDFATKAIRWRIVRFTIFRVVIDHKNLGQMYVRPDNLELV